jgi:hypothetical protein
MWWGYAWLFAMVMSLWAWALPYAVAKLVVFVMHNSILDNNCSWTLQGPCFVQCRSTTLVAYGWVLVSGVWGLVLVLISLGCDQQRWRSVSSASGSCSQALSSFWRDKELAVTRGCAALLSTPGFMCAGMQLCMWLAG